VEHPLNSDISGINLVMLHTGDRVPGRQDRNTVVLNNGRLVPEDPSTWTGALDRSPCGTGTSARMAALHARGQLNLNEDFVHRSIIGSEFVGRLTGTTTVAEHAAVLPTITGRAWITGHTQWVLDENDPFQTGYTLGDIWAPQSQ
jgi:proline racemase